MLQFRGTKPIFLILAGIFSTIAVLLLVVLIVGLHNNAIKEANQEVLAENTKYVQLETASSLTDNEIIHMYEFYVDNEGNVFDSNKVKYTRYEDSIRVLHEGQLYIVSVDKIKNEQQKGHVKQTEASEPKGIYQRNQITMIP